MQSESTRFIDSEILNHLRLVGACLTFECFSSQCKRIDFDKLDAKDIVHLHCGSEFAGYITIVRAFQAPIDFVQNHNISAAQFGGLLENVRQVETRSAHRRCQTAKECLVVCE